MNVNEHFTTYETVVKALRAVVDAVKLVHGEAEEFGPVEKAIETANVLVEELEEKADVGSL